MSASTESQREKILVVDDEEDIVELILLHLKHAGLRACSAGRGAEAVLMACAERPDLVVLDYMMPGMDGLGVLRRLRADVRTRQIPVIMLTAKGQTQDRIAGLEGGLDDYMTKPFSPRELVLRIEAILRRSKKVIAVAEQEVGPFLLDRKNLVLSVDGVVADLTVTELRLMTILMENPGVLHTRQELLNLVWGHADDSQSRTLDTHVKRLREKLGKRGDLIQTLRSHGYMLASKAEEGVA
jgi:two-component system, OmpR family, phosphate regulon response regulator PhoB